MLEEGQVVNGVVIAVDDQNKTVMVRIGKIFGSIDIKNMRWARKPDPEVAYYQARVGRPGEVLATGDVIQVSVIKKKAEENIYELSLEQTPKAQSALMCIESETGNVKVMVGGRDFRKSQFNRAVQSRRQPGSAFKPIIYSTAIDKGYTPATVLIDSPIVYQDTERDFTWKPRNYEEKFHGLTLLRNALERSRNVITIKILKDIGIDYVIDYARKFGIMQGSRFKPTRGRENRNHKQPL